MTAWPTPGSSVCFGSPQEMLPRDFGCSGMTCWRRLRDWQAAGAWTGLYRVLARSVCRMMHSWTEADSAGAADPGGSHSATVLGPLRAATDGADALQPAVPLVLGAGRRRSVWVPTGFATNGDRMLTTDMSRSVTAAIRRIERSHRCRPTNTFWRREP